MTAAEMRRATGQQDSSSLLGKLCEQYHHFHRTDNGAFIPRQDHHCYADRINQFLNAIICCENKPKLFEEIRYILSNEVIQYFAYLEYWGFERIFANELNFDQGHQARKELVFRRAQSFMPSSTRSWDDIFVEMLLKFVL